MEKPSSSYATLEAAGNSFLSSLNHPYFYLELLVIGIAIASAWIIGWLIKRRIAKKMEAPSQRKWSKLFFLNLATLASPLLALLILGFAKPVVGRFANGAGAVTIDAMQLLLAFMLARAVMMLVKSPLVSWLIAIVIMLYAVLSVSGFMKATSTALANTSFALGSYSVSMLGITQGIILLIVLVWAAGVLSHTLENYLQRSTRISYSTRLLVSKFTRITLYTIVFLIVLSAMGIDLTAFAIFGGALGVGIGLGLQKITSNFVSGITLIMEKSIKIGDLVTINNTMGWIRELNIRYALLETFDGRELIIPNETLVSTEVTNWTHSNHLARVEFTVGVAYGSDTDLVKTLILEAVNEHERTISDPEPGCFLREFGDSSLNFLVTFWISDVTEGRYSPQSDVMCALIKKFEAHNITIPFPQRDVHLIPATS